MSPVVNVKGSNLTPAGISCSAITVATVGSVGDHESGCEKEQREQNRKLIKKCGELCTICSSNDNIDVVLSVSQRNQTV